MLFEDEFSLSNTATLSSTWAPTGEQPKILCKQRNSERVTGFGSVNPITGQLTVTFAEKGNTETFQQHLEAVLKAYLRKENKRVKVKKIIIWLDNVKFHHALKLKTFLKDHPELELRFLPPYSPDLNPVERVWWYMRKHITHNRYMVSIKERVDKFWRFFSFASQPNEKLKNLCVINF